MKAEVFLQIIVFTTLTLSSCSTVKNYFKKKEQQGFLAMQEGMPGFIVEDRFSPKSPNKKIPLSGGYEEWTFSRGSVFLKDGKVTDWHFLPAFDNKAEAFTFKIPPKKSTVNIVNVNQDPGEILVYKENHEAIKKILTSGDKYIVTPNPKKSDYTIFVTLTRGTPDIENKIYTTVNNHLSWIPGSNSTTNVWSNTNAAYVANLQTSTPGHYSSVPVSSTHSKKIVRFKKELILVAVVTKDLLKKKLNPVWKISLSSFDKSPDLRARAPHMILGAMAVLHKNGKQKWASYFLDSKVKRLVGKTLPQYERIFGDIEIECHSLKKKNSCHELFVHYKKEGNTNLTKRYAKYSCEAGYKELCIEKD
jgi:hypothetical protein